MRYLLFLLCTLFSCVSSGQRVLVPGDWKYIPPAQLDPKWAQTPSSSPRVWSGQKASLRYADLFVSESNGLIHVCVDWSRASMATNTPTIPGQSCSLWRGNFPDPPSITVPSCYWIGKDLRLFRGGDVTSNQLMPFVVLEDGNAEDGHGGYVVGFTEQKNFAVDRPSRQSLTLSGTGKYWVRRFDGTWLAAFQCVAREHPAWFGENGMLAAGGVPDGMTADCWISVVAEWVQDEDRWNCSPDGWAAFLEMHRAQRRALLADPRLASTLQSGILFMTRRQPSWNHCVAQYFGWRQEPGGGLYVLEKPGYSLQTRDIIAGRHKSGSYLQPRLSYDAKKVLFSFVETQHGLSPRVVVKVNEEDTNHHYYHLWEVNVDGSSLKQLTDGVYEDFMPEFLPDGDIAFMSSRRKSQSRCFWFGYSNRWQAYTLFRMRADGSQMQQLSWNDVSEWFPTMSNDGEILFARWDYIDRDAVRHQNLWKMRPDGTNPMAVWGNETPNPHCTFQARAIPNSRKIVCIASAHHAVTAGPVILIDPSVNENSEAAITHITPGHYPEIDVSDKFELPKAHGTWKAHYRDNDWYNSPHPYGEDLFLVAWSRDDLHYEPARKNPDAALGLYVLKAGRKGELPVRELLWRDGCISAQCPEPLVPRQVSPKWIAQTDEKLAAEVMGEVFISDVKRGLKNVPPDGLKEIRVVQILPRTAPDQYLPNTGCGGHENARGVIGLAQVEDDGSCRFLVPAKVPLLFQVLDKHGRAWRTMRSTTSFMPGEHTSCVGCHEAKREASTQAAPLSQAMKKPAQRLKVPPEGGRPWGFVENIQPIFDRKCISCHAGEKAPKGIDLTHTIDSRFSCTTQVLQVGYRQYSAPFTKSYATLVFTSQERTNHTRNPSKKFQWYEPRYYTNKQTGARVRMVPNWPEYNSVQTTPEGCDARTSYGSGLIAKLSKGKHAQLVTAEEMRLLATWIDLNATFYGCYEEPDLTRQLQGLPISYPAGTVSLTDISGDATRQTVIAEGTPTRYEGHPTTLLSDDGKTLFCVWTTGHGGPCGPMARSDDGGRTWVRLDAQLPAVYHRTHKNCPTLQKAKAADGHTRYLVYSSKCREGQGLAILASDDLGKTWYEAPCQSHLSAKMPPTGFMALKDGSYALFGQVRKDAHIKTDGPADDQNVWMSRSQDGGLTWGPARIVASVANRNLCEPCCLRSPDGNTLVLLMRENRHVGRSMMCFSKDEGLTWSTPVDTPWALTGDRHEGLLLPNGKYVIAFRDRAPDSSTLGQFVAWVGSWANLSENAPGAYRVHLLKHYSHDNGWSRFDTGYPGVELLNDGTILFTTYSRHFKDDAQSSVVATRLKMDELQ